MDDTMKLMRFRKVNNHIATHGTLPFATSTHEDSTEGRVVMCAVQID